MHGCVSPLSVVGRTPSPVDPEHARVRAGSAQASLWHQQITIKTERRFEQTRRDRAPAAVQLATDASRTKRSAEEIYEKISSPSDAITRAYQSAESLNVRFCVA